MQKIVQGRKSGSRSDIGAETATQEGLDVFQHLLNFHNGFFENDDNNFKTMMAGFVLSTVSMVVIFGLYQL